MPISRTEKLEFKQSHAIVIGIDFYPLMEAHLGNPVNDAKEIADLLKKNQGFDNVLLMANPGQAELLTLLSWLLDTERSAQDPTTAFQSEEDDSRSRIEWMGREQKWSIDPGTDSILVYFAGHGIPGEFGQGPAGYLAPSDSDGTLTGKNIPMDTLYKALKALDCLHTLLILDCCFAGRFRQARSRFKVGIQNPSNGQAALPPL